MDAYKLLAIVMGIAALYLFVSSIDIGKKWDVDPSASVLSPGRVEVKKMLTPPEARVLGVDGKNLITLFETTQREINLLQQEEGFRAALNRSEKLLLYKSARGVNAVFASGYSGAQLEKLAGDERIIRELKNTGSASGTFDLSDILPSDYTDAKLKSVSIDGKSARVIAPYDMGEDVLADMRGSSEFSEAVKSAESSYVKDLSIYQDAATGERVLIPSGFSGQELEMLRSNDAVKSALAAMQVSPGKAVALGGTREFGGVDIPSLPYNPNTQIPISLDPFSHFSIPASWWLFPLAGGVISALLYAIYHLHMRGKYPAAKRGRRRALTELGVAREKGLARGKAPAAARKIISLKPIFEVKVVDNLLVEDGAITLSFINVSSQMIRKMSVASGTDEVNIAKLDVGEERVVRLKVLAGRKDKEVKVEVRFEPIIFGGTVWCRYDFEVGIERMGPYDTRSSFVGLA
ncbi:MAG: hypothetical protein AB1468_03845 [Candidatus Micrarchaeota archaeon]